MTFFLSHKDLLQPLVASCGKTSHGPLELTRFTKVNRLMKTGIEDVIVGSRQGEWNPPLVITRSGKGGPISGVGIGSVIA